MSSRPASGTQHLDVRVIFAVCKELRDQQQSWGWNIACKVPPALAPPRTGTELVHMHQRVWEPSSSAMGLKDHNQITSTWAGPRPKRGCFVGMIL